MDSTNLQNKLRLLFEKILEPEYVLNNYYVDSLLNKLKGSDIEINYIEKIQVLPELILNAIEHIDTIHISVKVFIIRVLAIVSQNELLFTRIFSKVGDKICKEFLALPQLEVAASVKVAFSEVSLGLLTHSSGVKWIMENQVWLPIYNLCFKSQTVFVLRQSNKFLADLLWKLSDISEEENLTKVLDYMLDKIQKNPYANLESVSDQEENEIIKKIEPTLQVLMVAMNDMTKIQQTNILIKVLHSKYSINTHLFSILSVTHREDIMHLLSKLVFLLVLGKIFLAKPIQEGNYEKQDFLELTVSYFNTLRFFVKRRFVVPLMDYCNTCCIIWSEAWSKSSGPTFETDGRTIEFQSQLLFILLVPVLVYIKRNSCYNRLDSDDLLNLYITRLLRSSCEHTARAAYSIRHLMYESNPLIMTLHCVKRLACLKNHLNNVGANLIFQALFYVLNNYVPEYENGEVIEDDMEDCNERVLVMTYVVDIIKNLVNNYDINWHESVETVCLYNQVQSILNRRNLSCKFVVAALNLITITIRKFMPPSLSLLLESKPGSDIEGLGKLIYSKLHDFQWEIRDSAMELLLVCTELSFVKYTPFQKQIVDNQLMVVAATVAFNDHEFYVQASAFRCIGAATKVNPIWEHLVQHHPDIQDKLITHLCNNPEGIVRKEIVNILCEMYQNLKLQPIYKQILYDHMVSNAISDFHWEVQIAALEFWRVVIRSVLGDQGMLDGKFPSVTFSKDSRKIVTLNESAIQKRLVKSLDDLANIGCLTVLVKLLHEDTDIDIMEYSLNIAKEFYVILQQYHIQDVQNANLDLLTNDVSQIVQEGAVSYNSANDTNNVSTPQSDSVIEGILNANDMNLLANIKLNEDQSKLISNEPKIKLKKYASPSLFLSYIVSKDFTSVIEENRKWKEGIVNLSSLLDDMLGIYECNVEVNNMDCY